MQNGTVVIPLDESLDPVSRNAPYLTETQTGGADVALEMYVSVQKKLPGAKNA